MQMDDLIARAVRQQATDIHLQPGQTLRLRLNSELIAQTDCFVSPEEVQAWLTHFPLYNEIKKGNCSFSLEWLDRIRCRVTLAETYAGPYVNIRILYPLDQLPPDDDEALLQRLSLQTEGLVLLCGPTNSGKTTALWRMIHYLNQTRPCHVITLEDPIEIVLPGEKALITQRELYQHFPNFAEGVRQALRQDPDVILVGEMRDAETMDAALTAAETGHLVLSTLHTCSAAQAVTRFVGAYPGALQEEVRYRLAMVLQAILSQRRHCLNGSVRIIREILLQTPAVAQLIRSGKEHQLQTIIQTSASQGMRTMEQASRYARRERG